MDRQKLLMIFGGAALAAALLTWFLYSATVAPKAEKLVQVIAANGNLPAGTRLQASHLKKITMAAKDVPPGVVREEKASVDRTLLYPPEPERTHPDQPPVERLRRRRRGFDD